MTVAEPARVTFPMVHVPVLIIEWGMIARRPTVPPCSVLGASSAPLMSARRATAGSTWTTTGAVRSACLALGTIHAAQGTRRDDEVHFMVSVYGACCAAAAWQPTCTYSRKALDQAEQGDTLNDKENDELEKPRRHNV